MVFSEDSRVKIPCILHLVIENAEEFSKQLSQFQDRATVLALKKALADARNIYNLIRLQGEYPRHQPFGSGRIHE